MKLLSEQSGIWMIWEVWILRTVKFLFDYDWGHTDWCCVEKKFAFQNIRFKMVSEVSRWFRISLLNLAIVAFIGVLLRYKIAFSLPFLDQHYLLHGHSHFAFAGWITQALMTLMVSYLFVSGQTSAFKKYRNLLVLNLITAYGMVISFPLQGYGFFAIVFSTLSIFVSYGFAFSFWKDLNELKDERISKWWFKGSLIFSVGY